jgi:hypothetical protein
VPLQPEYLATGAGGVWAADQGGRVVRVDPVRRRVVGRPIRVGPPASGRLIQIRP